MTDLTFSAIIIDFYLLFAMFLITAIYATAGGIRQRKQLREGGEP